MIRAATIAISLAGLSSAALAQNFSLTLDPGELNVFTGFGDVTITMAVYGDADVGTHMLGGSFSMVSNSSNVVDMSWTPANWSGFNNDGGFAGNGNYNTVVFGQLVLGGIFPPFPGSELGMEIGTFEITLTGIGEVDFELVAGSPFSLETVDQFTGSIANDSNGTLTLGTSRINVFPAPGVGASFAIVGLVASRRRRG